MWKRRNEEKRSRREALLSMASEAILQKQLFLDPELQFNDVVRATGTNRTYMWDAIHNLGFGFKGYLARFRLVYFIEHAWLEEYRRLSCDEIAERCGFSSRKLLDRYLKKSLGVTTSRYMELLRRK